MKLTMLLAQISLIMIFTSCDIELTPPENKAPPEARPGINQPIRPIVNLTGAERVIASRLCQNLRAQRLFLGGQPNGMVRNFSIEDRSCTTGRGGSTNVSATLNLTGSNYLWTPQRNITFHSPILTDRSVEMDRFCEEVQNAPTVENTALVGSRYIRFEFREFANVDRISLYSHESIEGQWRVQRIDEYEIDKSASPNLRGQTLASKHQFICRPNNTTGELIQRLR